MAGDRWLAVESIAAAVAILPRVAQRVFLTTGRQDLAAFAPLTDLWFLMRMIDPPTLLPQSRREHLSWNVVPLHWRMSGSCCKPMPLV